MSYLDKIFSLTGNFKPGSVNHVVAHHDDWCGVFSGKPCNCNPDISLETPEWVKSASNGERNEGNQ